MFDLRKKESQGSKDHLEFEILQDGKVVGELFTTEQGLMVTCDRLMGDPESAVGLGQPVEPERVEFDRVGLSPVPIVSIRLTGQKEG